MALSFWEETTFSMTTSMTYPTIDPIRHLHSLNLKCDGMFSLKSRALLMKLSKQSFRIHSLIEKMIIHLDPVKATTRKSELNQRITQCKGLTWNLRGNDRAKAGPEQLNWTTRWLCDWRPTWERSAWARWPGRALPSGASLGSAFSWGFSLESTSSWLGWVFAVKLWAEIRED